jgi:CubicO group peptidase (beta-lactamase class C family)
MKANLVSARLWFPAIVAVSIAIGCTTRVADAESTSSLLERLVDTLNTADQETYRSFVTANWARSALAERDSERRAAALAQIFTDTGGFADIRIVDRTPAYVLARARARVTDIPYCLRLHRVHDQDREFATDFSAREVLPMGPPLRTPSPREVREVVHALATRYAARDLFSGVILIAHDRDIVMRKAYGRASVTPPAPMRIGTRLSVASIGKMFTGVAIAQLADAGKLSLDDTIGILWPEYPDADVREHVTIRQLLTHTSGLGPGDYYDHPRYGELWQTLRSVQDYLGLVVGTPRGGKPGDYSYSNSGYILLGAIIERLSGQPYYEYVREHIFEPAGMSRSLYAAWDEPTPDVARPLSNFYPLGENAYAYRLGPFNPRVEMPPRGGPQGGAHVTADDLFSFARALRGGRLISPARFQEMVAAGSPPGAGAGGLAGDVREGLGVEVVELNGHTFFGHTGGDFGVASLLYWYPDSGYTTVLLSNRDPRAARVLANFMRALITRESIHGAAPPSPPCEVN